MGILKSMPLRVLIPGLLYFLALYSCSMPEEKVSRPPNIVIIFTDDQGYEDVGVFGSELINTPNLDRLASEGVTLTSFYSAQAVCSASRAALLTGCYPNRVNVHGALGPHSSRGLHPNEVTMAEMLREQGYATGIFGKWHLGDHPDLLPLKQGFDEFFGIPYSNDMWPAHPWQGTVFNFPELPLIRDDSVLTFLEEQSSLTTQITEESVRFINDHADEPFFLYVPHPQPHVPLFVSEKFKGKSERGLYGDVIMEIDWSVGEIRKALENNGIDSNTLIIFTSDNGPWLSYGDHAGSAGPFREGKGTAFEGGHREPFIAWFPEKLPAGFSSDVPVMTIDMLPTIANLTGATLPDNTIDGLDVWPVLTGNSDESPHEAYYFYYHTNELHAVRSGDHKLYFPHRYRTLSGRPGGTGGLPADYDYVDLEELSLYDLKSDPGETKNIANENEEVVMKLTNLADKMRLELGDALTGQRGTGNRPPADVTWNQTDSLQ